MAMQSTSIKIDTELKQNAQQLFSNLGMDMNTAVTIFLRHAVKEQAFPFEIKDSLPNSDTLTALHEVETMKKNPAAYRSYSDVDKMMNDLLA